MKLKIPPNWRSYKSPHLYIKAQCQYYLIVSLYVDDLIYTGNNVEMMKEFKEDIMKRFEMTDFGLMNYFLSIKVK